MSTLMRFITITSVLAMIPAAYAEEKASVTTPPSVREEKPFGIHLGVIVPFPSVLSFNLDYNVKPYLRVSAGVGTIGFGASYSVGATYLVSPDRPLSPIVGLDYVHTNVTDFLSGAFGFTPQPDTLIDSASLRAGIDWQTGFGFNLGLGVNWMFLANHADDIGTRVFPYAQMGWFF